MKGAPKRRARCWVLPPRRMRSEKSLGRAMAPPSPPGAEDRFLLWSSSRKGNSTPVSSEIAVFLKKPQKDAEGEGGPDD